MINTDSYYEIGAGHVFNQDYADSGFFTTPENGKKYYYAVVSDGCSGSKDSDIGARWMAKNFPIVARAALMGETSVSLRENIEHVLVEKMKSEERLWSIAGEAYDATLVAVIYDETLDVLHSFAWGDGHILLVAKEGVSFLTSIKYRSNAPYYLSYRVSVDREMRYEEFFGNNYADVTYNLLTDENIVRVVEKDEFKKKFVYDEVPGASKLIKHALVMTDGVETYHRKFDVDTTMSMRNVFSQFSQYKNTHGEFVKRRMQKVKSFAEKEEWQHFDDISVATISLV